MLGDIIGFATRFKERSVYTNDRALLCIVYLSYVYLCP